MRLFILFILVSIGLVVGLVLMAIVALANGASIMDLADMGKTMENNMTATRLIILINHLTMFILPGMAWAIIHHKKAWLQSLDVKSSINWKYFLMAVLFLIASYPIVAKSFEINQLWDLPEILSNAETQTAELLKKMLTMDSIGALLLNLLVIAIIPGIGEELIFRGIIQKELYRYFKNPYVAILIASIIFSAIHFQFAGFLPRMVLGIILGLIYFWTGNLVLPMLLHALNNGLQVIMAYFNPDMIDQEMESMMKVEWYILIPSIIITFLIGRWFLNQKNDADTTPTSIDITQSHTDAS